MNRVQRATSQRSLSQLDRNWSSSDSDLSGVDWFVCRWPMQQGSEAKESRIYCSRTIAISELSQTEFKRRRAYHSMWFCWKLRFHSAECDSRFPLEQRPLYYDTIHPVVYYITRTDLNCGMAQWRSFLMSCDTTPYPWTHSKELSFITWRKISILKVWFILWMERANNIGTDLTLLIFWTTNKTSVFLRSGTFLGRHTEKDHAMKSVVIWKDWLPVPVCKWQHRRIKFWRHWHCLIEPIII